MTLASWFSAMRHSRRLTRTGASRNRSRTFNRRASFETLEGRALLSTFTVNSLGDAGSGSNGSGDLRYCINQANADDRANTIVFDSTLFSTPQTIVLSVGQLELTDTGGTQTIIGPAAGVTINGLRTASVFQVDKGVTASISGLTMSHSASSYDDENARGLVNYGTATLTGCTISGNHGGGSGAGGGVNVGGGVLNLGTANLTDCTVSGNSGDGFGGGGLYSRGTVNLTDCTISDNSAIDYGGGLFLGGTAKLTDCTISGNSVDYPGDGDSPSPAGGGLCVGGDSITLTDTIVAGNTGLDLQTSTSAPNDINSLQGLTGVSGEFNLIGPGGSGGLTNNDNGNIVLTSLTHLGLAPLGDYGGPTQTMALLPGSVAIGNGIAASGVTADQRGFPLDSPTTDIGAFQTQPSGVLVVGVTGDAGAPPRELDLRGAVNLVNVLGGAQAITFNPTVFSAAKTVNLTSGQLELSHTSGTVTITGPAAGVTVSSGGNSPVFQVDASVTASISGLTISHSRSSSNGASAYGLYVHGTATVTDCTISGNAGGVIVGPGTATLIDCTISGNNHGVVNLGTANLTDCTISANSASASGFGGGGLLNIGTANLTDCTIIGNSASAATGGGGVLNAGTANLTDCTIIGNSASRGGGLANSYGTANLTDCTITGNSATQGGGVLNYAGAANLTACTISRNSGGGLDNTSPSGKSAEPATLIDTIVAGNTTDIAGTDVSGRYNLIGTGGSGGLTNGSSGNIVLTGLTGLGLAPLGDYGGPTQTMALLPGSAALGAGVIADFPGATTPITKDQRGEPLDTPKPDIGAFQSQGFTLTPAAGSTPQSAAPVTSFANPLAVTVAAKNAVEPVAGGVLTFTAPASGASANVSATTATIGSSRVASVTATANATGGSYTVTASAGGTATADFALTNIVPLTFSGISNRSTTYGASSVTISGTLKNGSQAPAGEGVAVTLDGIKQPATIGSGGSFSTTFSFESTGPTVSGSPYRVTYSYTSDGTFASASTTSTLTVGPATLTIKAAPETKVYGTADAALGYTATGFKYSDTAATALTGALARAQSGTLAGEQAGGYAITPGTLAASNYTIDFTGSTLKIAPAPLAVTVNPETKVYGAKDPSLTVGATGLVDKTVDGVAIDDTAATVVTGTLARAPGETVAGSPYAITQGTLAADSNYTIRFTGSNLTITPATPLVAVSAPGGTFTGAPISATVTVTGVNGTVRPSLEGVTPTLSYYAGTGTSGRKLGAAAPSAVGTYTVVASFPGSADYAVAGSQPATFVIAPAITPNGATIALTSSASTAVYGQADTFVATVTFGGPAGGTVTFSDGATALATIPLDDSGHAALTISTLSVGSHVITASYNGASGSSGVSSSTIAELVSPSATAIVLEPRAVRKGKKALGGVELTAAVDPVAPGGGVPTGTVIFEFVKKHGKKVKVTTLGRAALSHGEATLTFKPNKVLNLPLTVVYSGDPDFLAGEMNPPILTKSGIVSSARIAKPASFEW